MTTTLMAGGRGRGIREGGGKPCPPSRPLQERRGRWTCPKCGMRNRAFRNECFGRDCHAVAPLPPLPPLPAAIAAILSSPIQPGQATETATETAASDTTSNKLTTTTEFKDENSNVICVLSTELAKRIQSDLKFIVQGLVASNQAYKKDKLSCLEQTTILQKKMRKGIQVKADFDNNNNSSSNNDSSNGNEDNNGNSRDGALWGYARRKFSIRAVIALELWRSAQQHTLFPSLLEFTYAVFSMGGGPGNDLLGYMLFRKYYYSRGASSSSKRIMGNHVRLAVVDYAAAWASIVARVCELSGQDCIDFQTGDLTLPLHHETNAGFRQQLQQRRRRRRYYDDDHDDDDDDNQTGKTNTTTSGSVVFTFVYVLNEVMGSNTEPPPLLLDLLMHKEGGVFLFREPNTRAIHHVLRYFPSWRQGVDFWHLSNGGMMVLRKKQQHK